MKLSGKRNIKLVIKSMALTIAASLVLVISLPAFAQINNRIWLADGQNIHDHSFEGESESSYQTGMSINAEDENSRLRQNNIVSDVFSDLIDQAFNDASENPAPTAESDAAPAAEFEADPATEPTAEFEAAPSAESTADSATEIVAESVAEPAMEIAADSTSAPGSDLAADSVQETDSNPLGEDSVLDFSDDEDSVRDSYEGEASEPYAAADIESEYEEQIYSANTEYDESLYFEDSEYDESLYFADSEYDESFYFADTEFDEFYYFTDPEYYDYMYIEITSPEDGEEITGITDIIGMVLGESIDFYELSYAEAGGMEFTVFHRVERQAAIGSLGEFDISMLKNGYYTIRLTAFNMVGTGISCEVVVYVRGAMITRRMAIAYIDMAIPVAMQSAAMTVIRCYDSIDKNKSGDFGYGWSLSLSNARLSKSGVIGENWSVQRTEQLEIPADNIVETRFHEVAIDWGNDYIETFVVKPSLEIEQYAPLKSSLSMIYEAKGEQTTSMLEALDTGLDLFYSVGVIVDLENNGIYNPSRFKLTTEDGTIYVFDENGNVESVTDIFGDTVTLGWNGLYHSNGTTITFTRDTMDRITKITSPTGKEVSYRYNNQGNLMDFMGIAGELVSYSYDHNHNMIGLFDLKGARANRYEYDNAGWLIAVIDAGGNRTEIDSENSSEYSQFPTLTGLTIY